MFDNKKVNYAQIYAPNGKLIAEGNCPYWEIGTTGHIRLMIETKGGIKEFIVSMTNVILMEK